MAGQEVIYHGTKTKYGLGQRSGFYPGYYFSTSKEMAESWGPNLYSTTVDSSKIYDLTDQNELERAARTAGFQVSGGNGRGQVEYLKSLGFYGMRRGLEVILFDNYTQEANLISQKAMAHSLKSSIRKCGNDNSLVYRALMPLIEV